MAELPRCLSCILDDSEYFSHLPLTAKLALQQALLLKSFGKRDTLYAEGKASDHLYILISGGVKVYKSLMDGRQQIHKVVSIPGDLLACEDVDNPVGGPGTLRRVVDAGKRLERDRCFGAVRQPADARRRIRVVARQDAGT